MRSIGTLVVLGMLASPAAAQQQARTPTPAAAPQIAPPARTPLPPAAEMKGQPLSQGFSVVLVLGDLTGSASADANVPPAARKALNDMKDFLPYKGYRLLDAEWVLGSHSTTRLRGPEGQDYELTLDGLPHSGKLRVTFRLRDSAADSGGDMAMVSARTAERASIEQRVRELEREIASSHERGADRTPEATTRIAQLAELKRRLESDMPTTMVWAGRGRSVIDTSFDMDVAETVVVGTSRLKDTGKDGGRALIALLTAVPKNGGAAKQE
jgi:hypothetical protein